MKQRFIEWELEQDPNILARFYTGKMVDAGALRHVICNVDPPDDVSFEDTMKVLNEVAETVRLIPARNQKSYLSITEAIAFVQTIKTDACPVNPKQSDLAREYVNGWKQGCTHIQEALEARL